TRARLLQWAPRLRRIYPFMLVGAYVFPLMHQSSLGGLLLLAGNKINPLWQTPFLPFLYLLAAALCGLGFVTFLLLMACLRYARPLNMAILACLGGLLFRFIPTTIAFFPARHASYFPSTPELLMTIGYISLGIAAFGIAVKCFAVLPGEIKDWNYMFRLVRQRRQAAQSKGETSWPASLSTR